MRQIKIGAWPALSAPAAIVAWENLRDIRDAGRDPAAEKRTDRTTAKRTANLKKMEMAAESFTVRVLCNAYLNGHIERNRKKKGADYVRSLFDTLLDAIADIPAGSITRTQAFSLLESHTKIPVQASKLRAELGAAWDYALDSGLLPDTTPNWWRQIMRGKLKSKGKKISGKNIGKVKRVLSDGELNILLPWLNNFSDNVRDVLIMYLWTGLRGEEIVAIRSNEITEEPDGLWLTIGAERTKNARHEGATDLRVPLIGRAKEIVERRMKTTTNGYLFQSTVKKTPHIAQKAVQANVFFHQPYCETRPAQERPRLPVTMWAPHDLRRTARTMLAAIGCPRDIGEVIIGHMLHGVEGTYNRHTYDKERRIWLTRLSEHLEAISGD
ncbi:MAG: phage integrase family protein [Burkholderiaceae bacterium]|nr:phage integrase family protein [Burkholderiaceae bacterium]